jgi:hypothetical protein
VTVVCLSCGPVRRHCGPPAPPPVQANPLVHSVLGVDMNPAMVHLMYLKLAVALSPLTRAQAVHFFGGPAVGLPSELDRMHTLATVLSSWLPAATLAWLTTVAAAEVAAGIFKDGG